MTRTYSAREVRALMHALSSEEERIEELMGGPLGTGTRIPLPWCGSVREKDCQGLRVNHGLFTQCTNLKKDGDYCTTCAKSGKSNISAPGIPSAGNIAQRLQAADREYTVLINGQQRKETAYKDVVAKLKLTEEHVRSVAYADGIALPDDAFEKTSKTKSTSCVVEDRADPKAISTPPTNSGTDTKDNIEERPRNTNIVAALVQTARAPPPTRTEIAKAPAADLKTWCQSYAIQIGTKKVMQERLRAELGYTTPVKPSATTGIPPASATPAATATQASAPPDEPTAVPAADAKTENGSDMAVLEELSEEEYEEEEQVCDLFTDQETGTQYLKNSEGNLFDKASRNEVGMLYGEKVQLYADLEARAEA